MTSPMTTERSISQLEEAFGIFNRVSADLGNIYQELEASVAGLKQELAASNSARIRELTEKEQLAAKLSSLMEALPGGIVVLDASHTIKEMNPAAIRITGDAFIGDQWDHVIARIAAGGVVYQGELSLLDGKRVSITSSPFGADGDHILLMTDTTENYRLNNLLNREERLSALGEMAARLAHQIRTPLSSAILYLSTLSTRLARGHVQDSHKPIRSIQSQLGQIESLVEGMLAYIKGDIVAGRSFSPVTLLHDVVQATTMQAAAAGGVVIADHAIADFQIRGDREALFNALTNLVINAIQAVESGPEITVRLEHSEDGVTFSVADNGPGVDEEQKTRIFDPFYSTRPAGTGLGLAVVMSAAKAHGGEVTVDRSAQGGARFTLRIPAEPAGTQDYCRERPAA